MKPLPDWSLQALAEGRGIEAVLARTLLAARQELARSQDMLDGQCKANLVLHEAMQEGTPKASLCSRKYATGRPTTSC